MTARTVFLLCLISGVGSAVATRYYFPQVQVKTVETTKEVVRTDIKTVVHTVTASDGTTDTTTVTEDHSIKRDSNNKTAVANKQPQWHISGTVQSNYKLVPPIYGIAVNRRILGPIYLGALLNTNSEVGLSIGLEF